MTTEQEALLEIIKVGLTGECLVGVAVFDADWTTVFDLACKQGVVCLTWHGLEILYKNGVDSCPAEVKLQWYAANGNVKKAGCEKTAVINEFASLVKPVRLVVLKGLDYCRFWSVPEWREFGDLDCYPVDGDAISFEKKAIECGCRYEEDDYKHSRLYYKNLTIESHRFFTGFAGSKEGRLLEEELQKLFAQNSSKSFNTVQGCEELLSPNNEFTAVFMLAHAQGHFFHEGITLRNVLDWFFFLKNEESKVDWDVVNKVLEKTGLKIFADVMTAFCTKYLGLSCKTSVGEINDEMLVQFTDDVFAQKYSAHDRRWNKMIVRMLHRYKRLWEFRWLNNMPVYKAVWRTMAFSSFLHRKPVL